MKTDELALPPSRWADTAIDTLQESWTKVRQSAVGATAKVVADLAIVGTSLVASQCASQLSMDLTQRGSYLGAAGHAWRMGGLAYLSFATVTTDLVGDAKTVVDLLSGDDPTRDWGAVYHVEASSMEAPARGNYVAAEIATGWYIVEMLNMVWPEMPWAGRAITGLTGAIAVDKLATDVFHYTETTTINEVWQDILCTVPDYVFPALLDGGEHA